VFMRSDEKDLKRVGRTGAADKAAGRGNRQKRRDNAGEEKRGNTSRRGEREEDRDCDWEQWKMATSRGRGRKSPCSYQKGEGDATGKRGGIPSLGERLEGSRACWGKQMEGGERVGSFKKKGGEKRKGTKKTPQSGKLFPRGGGRLRKETFTTMKVVVYYRINTELFKQEEDFLTYLDRGEGKSV